MDRASLRTLVEHNTFLSGEERTYWLEHMPTMTDEQCDRLRQILAMPDDTIPFQAELEAYFGSLTQGAALALAPKAA